MDESIKVAFCCRRIFKWCLFMRPSKISERDRNLSANIVELASEGHGEHRASREARHGAH